MSFIDTETGKIVGGTLWKFYESNPYRAPMEESNATWLPGGELRDLCDSMYAQKRGMNHACCSCASGYTVYSLDELWR